MRKLFQKRARLAVYVEAGAADEMEQQARNSGMTFAEWAREVLLRGIDPKRGNGCAEIVGPGIYCGGCGKRHS